MTREEALAIAKEAYKNIEEAIEMWESASGTGLPNIRCYWDECIQVDKHFFHGHELQDSTH